MSKKQKPALPPILILAAKIAHSFKNPDIPQKPKPGKWYHVPMEGYKASDGSPYFYSFRLGTENKLMVFLNGGGVSWNEYTAARPTMLDAEDLSDCYYFPAAAEYGALGGGHGICSEKKYSPLKDWSIINLPYCTGDFHCGTNDFPYTAPDGSQKILYHHGYTNVMAAVEKAKQWVGETPEILMVTGNSAGGFGTALMTDEIMSLFPDCNNVISLVDSGICISMNWREIAENVWKAPQSVCEKLTGDDLTLDSMKALKAKHGERVKLLLSCSVRDYNLAQFLGYAETGKLFANKEHGEILQNKLKKACQELIEADPNVGIYIFDTPNGDKQALAGGLTRHCILPDDVAYTIKIEDTTVIEWLVDAINGNPKKIGMNLFDK